MIYISFVSCTYDRLLVYFVTSHKLSLCNSVQGYVYAK